MDFDNLTVVLLIHRDDAPEISDEETARLQNAHMAFLADLHDAGQLLAAGPVRDPSSEIRGISLMRVGPAEALAIKEQDPAVQAGVYRLRALPWSTPSGALHFTHTFMPRSIADVLGPPA